MNEKLTYSHIGNIDFFKQYDKREIYVSYMTIC